jgi:capsid portal protein
MGGASEENPGETPVGSVVDRKAYMRQLLQAYLACPWASTSIDAIARTSTAGGCMVVPLTSVVGNEAHPEAPPGVEKIQNLLKYVNPQDDIRQLMRGVITDLLIYGDSFTEVVYAAGEPVALYPLDPITITIEADEHGKVTGYKQTSETNRHASFEPHEIIHVKFDTPGNSLYGVSPTQKTILSITTWLFAKALVKDTMKRGDPLRAHVDWPMALSENERKKFQQQYSIRNLGARNIGNLFETKGGAVVREMGVNQIDRWQNVLQQSRDEILSGYGVPPSKVGVIEAGNLGGGTGTAQDKTFRVNTCGPIQEIVLEKFTFLFA